MMGIKPGSRYIELRNKLSERIRDKSISVLEEEAINHKCYFCLKRIKGKMFVLKNEYKENGIEKNFECYLDSVCFEGSKYYRYHKGFPVSMN